MREPVEDERTCLVYATENGRAIAIAQLLRMGHPVPRVVEAVRLSGEGKLDEALAELQRRDA